VHLNRFASGVRVACVSVCVREFMRACVLMCMHMDRFAWRACVACACCVRVRVSRVCWRVRVSRVACACACTWTISRFGGRQSPGPPRESCPRPTGPARLHHISHGTLLFACAVWGKGGKGRGGRERAHGTLLFECAVCCVCVYARARSSDAGKLTPTPATSRS
jgi:hypothetical protein